jgi:hypothetical protein
LPREVQVDVVAAHNIANESPAEKRERIAAEKASNRAEFHRRLAALREREGAP